MTTWTRDALEAQVQSRVADLPAWQDRLEHLFPIWQRSPQREPKYDFLAPALAPLLYQHIATAPDPSACEPLVDAVLEYAPKLFSFTFCAPPAYPPEIAELAFTSLEHGTEIEARVAAAQLLWRIARDRGHDLSHNRGELAQHIDDAEPRIRFYVAMAVCCLIEPRAFRQRERMIDLAWEACPTPPDVSGRTGCGSYVHTFWSFFREDSSRPPRLDARPTDEGAHCGVCRSPELELEGHDLSADLSGRWERSVYRCLECGAHTTYAVDD